MEKLSRLSIGFCLLAAALVAAGCRKEKTEPFGPDLAAASPPLELKSARPQDVKAFTGLSKRILAAAAEGSKGSFSLDLLGPTLILTTLLNSSENESLEKLSGAMGVPEGRHDLYTKSVQAQLDHLNGLKGRPVKQGSALWMIWPILLTPDFQNEMGEKLGVSVYRLGNAGITSSERIATWAKKVGAAVPPAPSLTKLDVMTATTVMSLDISGLKPKGSSQSADAAVSVFETEGGLQLLLISGKDPKASLAALDLLKATDELDSGLPAALPDFSSLVQTDPKQALSKAGFSFVFDGENDWRYMSIELRQSSLASLHSTLEVSWPSGGQRVTEPTAFMLWEPESQVILLGGMLQPESADGKGAKE